MPHARQPWRSAVVEVVIIMPSIEIMCVGQSDPHHFDDLPFAVVAERDGRSHRSRPLFQADFDARPGVLYHLGNPDLKADSEGRCFFAYKLLSPASQESGELFQFDTEFRPHAEAMLAELVRRSPERRVLFTSDWQFGPEEARRHEDVSVSRFWQLHDAHGLTLNTLYPIVASDDDMAVTADDHL